MMLTLDQPPIAKKRHRFCSHQGKSRTYDEQKALMRKMKWVFAQQMRDKGYLKAAEGPISFRLTACMPKPKSWSKKALNEAEGKWTVTKPDCDNICKFYLDVLNGIAYHDDKQVAELFCKKIYSYKPRVVIEITPLKENHDK